MPSRARACSKSSPAHVGQMLIEQDEIERGVAEHDEGVGGRCGRA